MFMYMYVRPERLDERERATKYDVLLQLSTITRGRLAVGKSVGSRKVQTKAFSYMCTALALTSFPSSLSRAMSFGNASIPSPKIVE